MKLREPYTFFVDRSLGSKKVVQGLLGAGYRAEAHDAHFRQDTLDVDGTMLSAFLGAMRKMERVLRRYDPPLVSTVTADSGVNIQYAEGHWLRKPRRVKGEPGR